MHVLECPVLTSNETPPPRSEQMIDHPGYKYPVSFSDQYQSPFQALLSCSNSSVLETSPPRMRTDLRWLVLRFYWFSRAEHFNQSGQSSDELNLSGTVRSDKTEILPSQLNLDLPETSSDMKVQFAILVICFGKCSIILCSGKSSPISHSKYFVLVWQWPSQRPGSREVTTTRNTTRVQVSVTQPPPTKKYSSFGGGYGGGHHGGGGGSGAGGDGGHHGISHHQGIGYSLGSGLVSIANSAVDQANNAIGQQHESGAQAAYQAKNSLAQNAAAAAATAQAALTGKQVIVATLEQQVRDLHAQVESEATQLDQATRSATAAQQSSQKAQHQVRALTAALNSAQANADQAAQAAAEASNELSSQSSMLAQAKQRLFSASEQLGVARADLDATQHAALRAAAAAATAQANANKHAGGSHGVHGGFDGGFGGGFGGLLVRTVVVGWPPSFVDGSTEVPLRGALQHNNNSSSLNLEKNSVTMLRNRLLQETLGKDPLDMGQYYRIFRTCRIPGLPEDSAYFPEPTDRSRHIVVVHNNEFQKAPPSTLEQEMVLLQKELQELRSQEMFLESLEEESDVEERLEDLEFKIESTQLELVGLERKIRQEQEGNQSQERRSTSRDTDPKLSTPEGVGDAAVKVFYRREGVANIHGPMYEVKLSLLVFLRNLNRGTIFDLCTNLDEAGAFDDVVYKSVMNQGGGDEVEDIVFLQLKHRDVDKDKPMYLLKSDDSFGIMKYFLSYCEIERQMLEETDHPIFSGKLENCVFVMFTNGTLESDFLSKSKEAELDKHVKEEIRIALRTTQNEGDVESIFNKLLKRNTKWSEKQGIVSYLDNCSEFWPRFVRKVQMKRLKAQSVYLKNLSIKFEEDKIKTLSERTLNNPGALCVVSEKGSLTISCLKIFMVLNESDHKDCVFVDSKWLMVNLDYMWSVWAGVWCTTLIVLCNDHIPTKKVLDEVKRVLGSNPAARVVFVCSKDDTLPKTFGKDCVFLDEIHFSQLTVGSQDRVLGKKVTFQGHDVSIKSVIGTNSPDNNITEKQLQMCVSPNVVLLKFEGKCLVNIQLKRKVNNKDNFGEQDGLTSNKVSDNLHHARKDAPDEGKIVILDRDKEREQFQYLCTQFSKDHKVHWLHLDRDSLRWKKSSNDLSTIKKYIDNESLEIQVEIVNSLEDNLVLVIAEPGMGKSSLLKHVAAETKLTDPSKFVLYINLNDDDKTDFLDEIELSDIDASTTKEFIFGSSKYEEDDSKGQILEYFFGDFHDTIVLMDSFDEISPDYSDKVCALIGEIRKSGVETLWVTSRPSMNNYLEDELSVLSYKMKPFSKDDQREFLKTYWTLLVPNIEQDCLEVFIEELLNRCTQSLNDARNNLCGIPLQTKMLADSFKPNLIDYNDTKSFNIPQKIDLHKLFDTFIMIKCDDYCDKLKLVDSKVAVKRIKKRMYKEFVSNHKACAALYLFHKDDILLISKECKCSIEETARDCIQVFEKEGGNTDKLGRTPLHLAAGFNSPDIAKALLDAESEVGSIDKLGCKPIQYGDMTLSWGVVEIILTKESCTQNLVRIGEYISDPLGKYQIGALFVKDGYANLTSFLLCNGYNVNAPVDNIGSSLLHLAADYGHLNIVKCLVDKGADINQPNREGFNPLHVATRSGHLEVVQFLVGLKQNFKESLGEHKILLIASENGHTHIVNYLLDFIDVNTADSEGCTALHAAVRGGQLEVVQLLVKRNAHINCKDVHGYTALKYCVRGGRLDVLEFLVKNKGDINLSDENQVNLLHHASRAGQLESVKYLVSLGIDINSRDGLGFTALHHAIRNSNLHIVTYLTEANADLNLPDNSGQSPLIEAAKYGKLDIVKYLFLNGAKASMTDNDGCDVFLYATRHGRLNVVEYLFEMNANTCSVDKRGLGGLHFASINGSPDVVKYLVGKAFDVKASDKDGLQALHYAAQYGVERNIESEHTPSIQDNTKPIMGHLMPPLCQSVRNHRLDTFKDLLKDGGDINATDKLGRNVLHHVIKCGGLEFVRHIVDMGGDINVQDCNGFNALHYALRKGEIDVVQYLILKGADVNAIDANNSSLIHIAVRNERLDILQCLVKEGGNLNIVDKSGFCALHYAVQHGNISLVKCLVENHANIELPDSRGYRCLHFSSQCKNLEVVKYLIRQGAELDAKDMEGNTALHISAQRGCLEVSRCLVEAEATIDTQNNKGHTALKLAKDNGHNDVVEYLERRKPKKCVTYDNKFESLRQGEMKGGLLILKYCPTAGDHVSVVSDGAYGGWIHPVEETLPSECHDLSENNFVVQESVTSLHRAARSGKIEAVELAIREGAEINLRDNKGLTALHHAVHSHEVDVLNVLLRMKADCNIGDHKKLLPLHYAISKKSFAVVQRLVEGGSKVNCPDDEGLTALHLTAKNGKIDYIKYILQNGADVNQPDSKGLTALHHSVRNGTKTNMMFLISKGANLNAQDKRGLNALHHASISGRTNLVECLVKMGVDLDVSDRAGMTAFHHAVKHGRMESVEFLANKTGGRVNIHAVDGDGSSALHHAAWCGHLYLFQYLVNKGLDINLTDNKGFKAMHYADIKGHTKIVDFFSKIQASDP
uniref:Uncharacterized protein n=1 Tax=Timema shepardi TaxID=629360 RepID=A0A7R9G357_TIMSH|nr:unnamed protein product [Timema shepardi]